ncbi:hypothetical protein GWI34_08610 [Actinomadura sp. DSM 109109]|nr:hypothetical protein [Actinomadura lepetitiana]
MAQIPYKVNRKYLFTAPPKPREKPLHGADTQGLDAISLPGVRPWERRAF